MSYLPVVWAGLFAYLGTSADACRRVPAERSRLCEKCPVSIARGNSPGHARCDTTLNRGGYNELTCASSHRILFSLVGSLGIKSLRG